MCACMMMQCALLVLNASHRIFVWPLRHATNGDWEQDITQMLLCSLRGHSWGET